MRHEYKDKTQRCGQYEHYPSTDSSCYNRNYINIIKTNFLIVQCTAVAYHFEPTLEQLLFLRISGPGWIQLIPFKFC